MTVKDLHRKSMEYYDKAIIAIQNNEDPSSLYLKAFEFEKNAYLLFVSKSQEEPTRSVLLRSAASLAMMAKLYEEAEKLIAIAIIGNPPTEILEELRSLNFENTKHLNKRKFPFRIKVDPPKSEQPTFKIGDSIFVNYKTMDGGKEKIDVFEGSVVQIKGSGTSRTFTIRKIMKGVGEEITIPVLSPLIEKIEILKRIRTYKERAIRAQSFRTRKDNFKDK